jgi:hypothetical protein
MFDLLRLYGSTKLTRTITQSTDTEVMYAELKKLTRTKKDLTNLYNILRLSKSDFDYKVFIEDAITAGVILVTGNEYKLIGGQPIGYSKDEAIAYFKNPEHQSVKLQLQAQIKQKLKL